MPNHKILARKEENILRQLTLILNREFDVKELNAITISEVRLSKDGANAKIFYSFIPFSEDMVIEAIEKALIDNHREIRMHLASKIDLRIVPELSFVYDTSLQNANKIENILKEINKK